MPVERGVVVTVIGGTASVLGGGRFANGATTAAFGYLFNEMGNYVQRGYAPPGYEKIEINDSRRTILPKWGSENFLAMVCTADCLPVDRLVITGGQEIYTLSGQPAHDLRGAHPKNLAIDLGIASNPALNKLDGTVLMCAAKCGYTHGMRHGPQDHFHLQIGPALSVPPIMVR